MAAGAHRNRTAGGTCIVGRPARREATIARVLILCMFGEVNLLIPKEIVGGENEKGICAGKRLVARDRCGRAARYRRIGA